MNNNCFTCQNQNGCLRTWECFDDPDNFNCGEYIMEKNKLFVLDLNNTKETYHKLFSQNQSNIIKIFQRGSRTYGTNHEKSDYDYGVVVSDDTTIIDVDGVFDNEKADKRIHPFSMLEITNGDFHMVDFEIVKESDFNDLLKEHEPFAIESIILENHHNEKVIDIDPWKLRCKFGQIANNSWSKAKKKMTVEKDLDIYIGVKSLFHSIRLQMFACYFVKGYVTIDERKSVVDLYDDIMHDWTVNNFTWEDFKNKYKPIYNYWHSEMVKCCHKPEEEFKNNRK